MSDLDLNAIRKQLAADMRRSTPTKGAIQESALALLDRLAAVEAERDAAREQVRHMHDVLDRAEAERDAARGALARVEALAAHWRTVGGPSSPRGYGEQLRAALSDAGRGK